MKSFYISELYLRFWKIGKIFAHKFDILICECACTLIRCFKNMPNICVLKRNTKRSVRSAIRLSLFVLIFFPYLPETLLSVRIKYSITYCIIHTFSIISVRICTIGIPFARGKKFFSPPVSFRCRTTRTTNRL